MSKFGFKITAAKAWDARTPADLFDTLESRVSIMVVLNIWELSFQMFLIEKCFEKDTSRQDVTISSYNYIYISQIYHEWWTRELPQTVKSAGLLSS